MINYFLGQHDEITFDIPQVLLVDKLFWFTFTSLIEVCQNGREFDDHVRDARKPLVRSLAV